jgi:hypothetical protein
MQADRNGSVPSRRAMRQTIHRQIHKAYIDGFSSHLNAVKKSPKLLEWVLKKDYFNCKLPVVWAHNEKKDIDHSSGRECQQ